MTKEAEYESSDDSPTRNSLARKKLAFIPEILAWGVHKIAPWLSPHMVTAASAFLTAEASYSATIRNTQTKIPNLITALKQKDEKKRLVEAQALDSFDGALAREINRVTPGRHDTRLGGLLDALNDRWGHLTMGTSRIVTACQRDDLYGIVVAEVATITGPWPAYLRSEEESKGNIVSESGDGWKDPFGFFGTHLGRTILAIPATLYPNIKVTIGEKTMVVPVQNINDTISTISNIVTIYRRIKGGKPMKLPEPTDKDYAKEMAKRERIIDDAKYRRKWLLGAAIGTGATVLGMHFLLAKKEIKN